MRDYTMMRLVCDCNNKLERGKILDSLSKYGFAQYLYSDWYYDGALWHLFNNKTASEFWEDLADEFCCVSKHHPNVHFELEIQNDEYWCDYIKIHYLGGKMQVCYGTMNFEPFDPEKLN